MTFLASEYTHASVKHKYKPPTKFQDRVEPVRVRGSAERLQSFPSSVEPPRAATPAQMEGNPTYISNVRYVFYDSSRNDDPFGSISVVILERMSVVPTDSHLLDRSTGINERLVHARKRLCAFHSEVGYGCIFDIRRQSFPSKVGNHRRERSTKTKFDSNGKPSN